MLTQLHEGIARLLAFHGGIPPEVDIRFEPPTAELQASLLRPTISFFLFDLSENTDLRQTAFQNGRADGRAVRRLPPRRFDLRYLVTVLTNDIEDQHVLLWRMLTTLLRYQVLPVDILPEAIRSADPPLIGRVEPGESGTRPIDLWGAFDLPPRPSLLYVVTAPVELDIAFDMPLVLTRTARFSALPEQSKPDAIQAIGGSVRGPAGEPVAGVSVAVAGLTGRATVTNSDGRYILSGVPNGAITLEVRRGSEIIATVDTTVPSPGYDITVVTPAP